MTAGTLTIAVAIYGAVLASVNALWTIRRDILDKGRLKLSMMVGRVMSGAGPVDREAQMRAPKPSAHWLGAIARANALER